MFMRLFIHVILLKCMSLLLLMCIVNDTQKIPQYPTSSGTTLDMWHDLQMIIGMIQSPVSVFDWEKGTKVGRLMITDEMVVTILRTAKFEGGLYSEQDTGRHMKKKSKNVKKLENTLKITLK